ncbi:L,D-transpeptidase family protein [Endozoicomonas sp. SM1973]|uniref:L,D-transpeptidase family protein n=1 Tax=Spartinivicinus marinus TaxID=2994442 RepID=A0A853I6K7_9GAMM|nr:L,D-transpeptidase family protein [Spartinivicinus marinus]MCX4025761.1 L,D-transpeptidase family protein [Spartinivicinus marinus]NYZ65754.1 L,D-transpeptidase family protein [Spartinivicinus marinus]
MLSKAILISFFITSSVGAVFIFGKPIWYPYYIKLVGVRTVKDVIDHYQEDTQSRLKPYLDQAGFRQLPAALTMLAIKDEKKLELWGQQHTGEWVFIRSFPVLAASGKSGPKLREGDRQVPEGIYKIIGFNPNSSYHLSMKLNYPNTFDLKYAKLEGRHQPGTNIFIHGKAASIGCLAIGDRAIEELFVLSALVGKENIQVVIAPSDPRKKQLKANRPLPWWTNKLYQQISTAFQPYSHQKYSLTQIF